MRAPLPRLARLALALGLFTSAGRAQDALTSEIERRAAALAGTVAGWRHDIHQHPELSNQETRTAALVAAHLRKLGLEVRTGVGGNGVVSIGWQQVSVGKHRAGRQVDVHVMPAIVQVWDGDELLKTAARKAPGAVIRKKNAQKAG